jgi:signal transduction histidine kinase
MERDNRLELANQQLRRADEEKNKLVLRTTHDLKAPFSGIESNIQVLRLQCGDELSEKAKEILERIERRSHALAGRIRDILLLGQIRAADAALPAMETVKVDRIIEGVVSELADEARSRNITIRMDLAPVEIPGNVSHYAILFLNLISNAVTYSHDGGTVSISMFNKDRDTHVVVADQGIGIDEEALPNIFDEYYRTADAASYNPKSTGLGLSIVQEIARKANLDITVTSTKGKGTEFDVSIPGDCCSFGKKDV